MNEHCRKRADEIREQLYARFSEIKPLITDYFDHLASASHASAVTTGDADAQRQEQLDVLFDLYSEQIARAEDATGVTHTSDQVLARVVKDIRADMMQLALEEQDRWSSQGRH